MCVCVCDADVRRLVMAWGFGCGAWGANQGLCWLQIEGASFGVV